LSRRVLNRLVAGALAAIELVGVPSFAASGAPTALRGRWVVQQVAVDSNDRLHRSSEPDDPRLMGNVLDILADGTLDPTRQDCKHAQWQPRRATSLAAIVAGNKRESSGRIERPSLADYALKFGDPKLAPYEVFCTSEAGKHESFNGGNWFASVSASRMIEGNGVDTVMVYDRITDTTPVKPSFACTPGQDESEKAICNSQILAGLDRSVAMAYRRARERTGDTPVGGEALLRKEQADWIAERDRCKADENCLIARMGDRIDALMQR
jgi:uncharacterized protein YecT (DUF1311 family)